MVVVGCGSIKSKTLAGLSLEVGASGVATDKKKGSPKLKGKSPQKKGGSGGQKGTCVDDRKLTSTLSRLNVNPVPGVIKCELVLKDGRTVTIKHPNMRMNREGCVFYLEGETKTTAAARQRKPSAAPPPDQLIQTPGLSLDTLAQLAEAEDKEEAAVEAIMRAPMTAREVLPSWRLPLN